VLIQTSAKSIEIEERANYLLYSSPEKSLGPDRFAAHRGGFLSSRKATNRKMPQMIVQRPFAELKLPDKDRLKPQCRMPDYAASRLQTVA
jgi:hypothetical protein